MHMTSLPMPTCCPEPVPNLARGGRDERETGDPIVIGPNLISPNLISPNLISPNLAHADVVVSDIANSNLANSNPASPNTMNSSAEDERCLLRAFRSFAAAADSLERSYLRLQGEVERLRGELEETRGQLAREQALAEMSAVLAHEIRNPLASLELFAGLLAESELDAECREWVGHVQAGLRTLGATVNNVLHFHSLPEPERSRVDLGQLLEWARDFLMPLMRQSRVALSLQNRVAGVFFSADRHRLEQVLLNLVLNALRAMPGGGWIELSGRTSEEGRAVLLAVADTGPGICAEHLSSIFDPRFSTRANSTGLGLAVCRRIVEQHGGAIRAESLPGRGAKFTISFPLRSSLTVKPANGVAQ
jgi:signal transduction histidine kinase